MSNLTTGEITGIIVAIFIGAGLLITLGTLLFKFATWRANVNTDRSTFKDFIDEVKVDLKKINRRLIVLSLQNPVEQRGSPTRLNDLGKSISEEIQGKQWAEVVAKQYVDAHREKQPYDIQQFAFDQAYKFEFSKDMLEKMKQSAWENGVPIEIIIRVLAYELRDELLVLLDLSPPKEHPDH